MRDTIDTDRLQLRKLRLSDAPDMAKLMNHPEILNMTASLAPVLFTLSSEFWILRQLSHWQRGIGHAYAITKNNEFMGIMDLFNNHKNDREIGYWIGKPYWGKGFVTEAGHALIKEAFTTLPLEFIDAGYFSDNPASGHILKKFGFTPLNEDGSAYSIARGTYAAGIKLRLHRKTAMNRLSNSTSR